MSSDIGWLIDQIGKPIPCAICCRRRPAKELREIVVPGHMIHEWDIVIDKVEWVCAEGCTPFDPFALEADCDADD